MSDSQPAVLADLLVRWLPGSSARGYRDLKGLWSLVHYNCYSETGSRVRCGRYIPQDAIQERGSAIPSAANRCKLCFRSLK